jgi:hypothetical protein
LTEAIFGPPSSLEPIGRVVLYRAPVVLGLEFGGDSRAS